VVIVGAHYDHLGMGGPGSLAPDAREPHLGADDNASGVAALLEAARLLSHAKGRARDVLFVAFSGEELGVLGSSYFVEHLPAPLTTKDVVAMVNMDMVGRMRENRLSALGAGSAVEWPALVSAACGEARVSCTAGGDGYGPSDHSPFYAAGVPVLHLFTGAHGDYHKPSDSIEHINAAGMGQVAHIAASLARTLTRRSEPLHYQKVSAPPPSGDLRSYGASLGTIPDYAGPPGGAAGVLLAGVREGSAAAQAGMKRGDILIELSSYPIANVRDFMYALGSLKPEQTVKATVLRAGKKLVLHVTLQRSQRRGR
jgi:Iap family predicted aminopeptidase